MRRFTDYGGAHAVVSERKSRDGSGLIGTIPPYPPHRNDDERRGEPGFRGVTVAGAGSTSARVTAATLSEPRERRM
jgi:hypothetical protein